MDVNNAHFERYWSLCEERGITVTVDMGAWGAAGYRIDRFIEMLSHHSNLTFVVAHSLFPSNTDGNNAARLAYIKRLAGENVYFDIASLYPSDTGDQYAYLREVMDIVGADHMMWGPDCPGVFKKWSYAQLARFVCQSGYFTERELQWLMHDTAVCVYR